MPSMFLAPTQLLQYYHELARTNCLQMWATPYSLLTCQVRAKLHLANSQKMNMSNKWGSHNSFLLSPTTHNMLTVIGFYMFPSFHLLMYSLYFSRKPKRCIIWSFNLQKQFFQAASRGEANVNSFGFVEHHAISCPCVALI
jgi:hypothetical protein